MVDKQYLVNGNYTFLTNKYQCLNMWLWKRNIRWPWRVERTIYPKYPLRIWKTDSITGKHAEFAWALLYFCIPNLETISDTQIVRPFMTTIKTLHCNVSAWNVRKAQNESLILACVIEPGRLRIFRANTATNIWWFRNPIFRYIG